MRDAARGSAVILVLVLGCLTVANGASGAAERPRAINCTITWTAGIGSDQLWSDASNWTPTSGPSRVPDGLDNVCINSPGADTPGVIIRHTTADAGSIEVSDYGHCLTIESGAELRLGSYGSFSAISCATIAGTLRLATHGVLELTGSFTIAMAGGSLLDYGIVDMNRSICVYGAGKIDIEKKAHLLLNTSDSITTCGFTGGLVTNLGQVSKPKAAGPMAYSWIHVPFTNEGAVWCGGGEILIDTPGLDQGAEYVTHAKGTIVLAATRTLKHATIQGVGVSLTGSWTSSTTGAKVDVKGTLTWSGAKIKGQVEIHNNAHVKVTSTVMTAHVQVDGTLTVCATCTLNVSGTLTEAAEGTIDVGVSGIAPNKFSQLVLGGEALISGKLNAVDQGGFSPTSGEAFKFLYADPVKGTFSNTATGPYHFKYVSTIVSLVAT